MKWWMCIRDWYQEDRALDFEGVKMCVYVVFSRMVTLVGKGITVFFTVILYKEMRIWLV